MVTYLHIAQKRDLGELTQELKILQMEKEAQKRQEENIRFLKALDIPVAQIFERVDKPQNRL